MNSYEEIKEGEIIANTYYFGLSTLFKSKLLSKRSKTLYKILIRPIVSYAYEIRTTTRTDENKLGIFKRKILRKILSLNKNKEGEYEIRTNEKLKSLYGKSNFI